MLREVPLTGWYIGYIVIAIVVALVVVLVAAMLHYTRRIGLRAQHLGQQLDDIRERTLPLGEAAAMSDGIRQATEALTQLREGRRRR